MSTNQKTYEEREAESCKVLGDELGIAFIRLVDSTYDLRCRWQDYVEFFGIDKDRVDLLNEIDGGFAHHLQQALYETVALRICRLTDKDTGRGRYTRLSVRKLKSLIPPMHGELHADLNRLIKNAEKLAEPFRELRDNILAHSDYGTATGRYDAPFLPSRRSVSEVLDALSEIVQRVHLEFFRSTLLLDQRLADSGAASFYFTLKDGQRLEALRREFATNSKSPTLQDLMKE